MTSTAGAPGQAARLAPACELHDDRDGAAAAIGEIAGMGPVAIRVALSGTAAACRHCCREIVSCGGSHPAVLKLDSAPDVYCWGWRHRDPGGHFCSGPARYRVAEPAEEVRHDRR